MPWVLLTVAGLLEIIWAYYMKLSDGFSKPWPTLATFVAMFASFGLLSLAMKQLPLGTSYMVWTGIGALGAFVVGIALLGESVTPLRLLAAAMLLGGLVLMKLASRSRVTERFACGSGSPPARGYAASSGIAFEPDRNRS